MLKVMHPSAGVCEIQHLEADIYTNNSFFMTQRLIPEEIIATLRLPKRNIFDIFLKPWLGWNIFFVRSLTIANILQRKPFVEQCLNEYLQANVDVISNKLIVPFNCTMTVSKTDPRVYSFKVQVFARGKNNVKILFKYPSEPINRINGFNLVKGSPVGSQLDSVTIKPPPN